MNQPKAKKSPWARFGKVLHILVVVAFFLPFFGVSCSDPDAKQAGEMDIITMSGTQMAFGCEPGGMMSEAADNPDMRGMGGEMKIDKLKVEPLAIVGLLCAVGGVLAAFLLKGRKAVMASLVASALCVGAVVGLWVKVRGEIDTEITEKLAKDMGKSSMMKDSKIESGTRMGLWIALACLAGCVALSALALKDRETMPDVVPPGGPEGAGSSMV
jgi:hypothetical protein